MTRSRFIRVATLVATLAVAGLVVPAAPAGASTSSTTLVPPTNLRVTSVVDRYISFQWDHAQGLTFTCTTPMFLYYLYRNGRFVGTTYWGSPVAAAYLAPGQTAVYRVQGRDNCSTRMTAFSEPLYLRLPG